MRLLVFVALLGCVAAVVLPWLADSRHGRWHKRAVTQNVMMQWGLALRMYASDNDGTWPPPALEQAGWGVDVSRLYPEYITDLGLLVSPGHPRYETTWNALESGLALENRDWTTVNQLTAESFGYFGHIFMNVADVEALERARAAGELETMESNYKKDGEGRIIPLRDKAERFLYDVYMGPAGKATEMQANVPVMIDISCWREQNCREVYESDGTYVLYMDGHVAFVPLGTFPVLPEIMDVL